jgi:uncharacterized protein (TIGR02246 family)
MPARTPRLAIDRLMSALRDGDLDTVLSMYEEDATLVVYPGMLGKGIEAIRSYYEGVFRVNSEVEHGQIFP